jgi:hypothetical protein
MPADAATVANPYAKAGDTTEAPKKLTAEEKEAKASQNKVLFAVPLVASVALSVPFFKRNLERMGEKVQRPRHTNAFLVFGLLATRGSRRLGTS